MTPSEIDESVLDVFDQTRSTGVISRRSLKMTLLKDYCGSPVKPRMAATYFGTIG